MNETIRGVLGLGVTLFVLAAGMGVVNGLVRGWASKELAKDPSNENARALLMLY
jgi:hypothetical protein